MAICATEVAAADWPCDADTALGTRHDGEAVINGVTLPIIAWISTETTDPMPALRAACSGRAAVAVNRWPTGDVALIAPIRSRQCPLCPLPAPTLKAFAEQVFAVSNTTLPGSDARVLIGSPVGQLYGVKPARSYQGKEWKQLGPSLTNVLQSNYRFAKAEVGSLTASTRLTPAAAMRAADADLISYGYALLDGAAETEVSSSNVRTRTYKRDQSVLNVRVDQAGDQTNITISESQAG